jgi:hypothetical protein
MTQDGIATALFCCFILGGAVCLFIAACVIRCPECRSARMRGTGEWGSSRWGESGSSELLTCYECGCEFEVES